MNQTSDYYEERIQELVNRIQELEETVRLLQSDIADESMRTQKILSSQLPPGIVATVDRAIPI